MLERVTAENEIRVDVGVLFGVVVLDDLDAASLAHLAAPESSDRTPRLGFPRAAHRRRRKLPSPHPISTSVLPRRSNLSTRSAASSAAYIPEKRRMVQRVLVALSVRRASTASKATLLMSSQRPQRARTMSPRGHSTALSLRRVEKVHEGGDAPCLEKHGEIRAPARPAGGSPLSLPVQPYALSHGYDVGRYPHLTAPFARFRPCRWDS